MISTVFRMKHADGSFVMDVSIEEKQGALRVFISDSDTTSMIPEDFVDGLREIADKVAAKVGYGQ